MAASTTPIFTAVPDVSTNGTTGMPATLTTGANNFDGTSGSATLIHTAGTNGSFIERIRAKALGTNVQTVLRIFINNGSTVGTASNNFFYGEITLPATTSLATGQTSPDIDYQMNIRLPSGYKIYALLATTVAAGWQAMAIAGQY